MLINHLEANPNLFGVAHETQFTEGSQSTASFYHPTDSPKASFRETTDLTKELPQFTSHVQNFSKTRHEDINKSSSTSVSKATIKSTPQLPKLNIPKKEQSGAIHFKRGSEVMRGYITNDREANRPRSKDINGLFSHRERIQEDNYLDFYKVVTNEFNNDDRNQRSYSQRGERHSYGSILKKPQDSSPLKGQNGGVNISELYKPKLGQVTNNENSGLKQSPSYKKQLQRCRTTEILASGQPKGGENENDNQALVEKINQLMGFTYMMEQAKASVLENKGNFQTGKNLLPLQAYPSVPKSQKKVEENRKIEAGRSIATVIPGLRRENKNCFQPDQLLDWQRMMVCYYNNDYNRQSGKDEKNKYTSIDSKSAELANDELKLKFQSNKPQIIQRTSSDVKKRYAGYVEDNSPIDSGVNKNLSTTKLKSKFRVEEAILNKLFNKNNNFKS